MEKRNYKQYRTTSFWTTDNEDVIFFRYAPKLEIDIHVAREIVASRLDYTQGRSVYTLIDFSNVKSVTKEARDYMNSPEGGLRGILGGAFLSNSVVATLFVNLYLKISNPSVPAKFFTNENDAIGWLKKIRKSVSIPVLETTL